MSAQGLGFCLALVVLQLALISPTLGLAMIVLCAGIASLITLSIQEDLRRIKFSQDYASKGIYSKEEIIRSLRLSARFSSS